MEKNKLVKRIVWAIDPFVETEGKDGELLTSVGWAVRTLASISEAEVEPVYVLNEVPLGILATLPPEIVRQTESLGQETLDAMLNRVKIKNLLPLRVLPGAYPGQSEIAQALVNYAKRVGADLIVLGTHGRKGLTRLFMGSFAEAMMLRSDVPLFVVNPNWKSTTDFKNVLFPTDFSKESQRAFIRVVNFAKILKSNLTIFHQVHNPAASEIPSSFSFFPFYGEAYEVALQGAQRKINRLVAQANEQGVKAGSFVEFRSQKAPSETILDFVRDKHFIVAMAARSGEISATLLGSTTRRVVRESTYPVWVIHPDKNKSVTTKREQTGESRNIKLKRADCAVESDLEREVLR